MSTSKAKWRWELTATLAVVGAMVLGVAALPWLLRSPAKDSREAAKATQPSVEPPPASVKAVPSPEFVESTPAAPPAEDGNSIVPRSRPAGRPAVKLATADVPPWFRTAVERQQFDPALLARGPGLQDAGEKPVMTKLPTVPAPADALARLRPLIATNAELSAWFGRYWADVAADRPVTAGRLDELRAALARGPISPAARDAGEAVIVTLQGPESAALAVWRTAAVGAASAAPATAPATPPGSRLWDWFGTSRATTKPSIPTTRPVRSPS